MPIIIAQLPHTEWQQYRNFRLEALQESPNAFGNAYATEQHFPEEQWRAWIANVWFALENDIILGMIGFLPESPTTAQIVSFRVTPKSRGKGIGKTLLVHMQTLAKNQNFTTLYLYVTTTQTTAIALYHALGFITVSLEKNHIVRNTEALDQYLMTRSPLYTSLRGLGRNSGESFY